MISVSFPLCALRTKGCPSEWVLAITLILLWENIVFKTEHSFSIKLGLTVLQKWNAMNILRLLHCLVFSPLLLLIPKGSFHNLHLPPHMGWEVIGRQGCVLHQQCKSRKHRCSLQEVVLLCRSAWLSMMGYGRPHSKQRSFTWDSPAQITTVFWA